MARVGQLDPIRDLPVRSPLDVVFKAGYIPVSSGVWLTPAELAQSLQPPATTGQGILEFLAQHSTAVYLSAGALLLLAMFGRR